MNQELVEKIVKFLFENNVTAADMYFYHRKIFNEMAKIEDARQGIEVY